MVTPQSPEAMEEVLWQAFFKDAHDPLKCQSMTREHSHLRFERFYRQHIQKMLLIRNGTRYVSKGNYNLARLGYIQKVFRDARFIIPIRRPHDHVASLMKQHRLFTIGETKYPAALKHMQRVGHFEFGLDRRPIHVGNAHVVQQIQRLWDDGQETRGWARYWAYLYGWMADQLESDSQLRDAAVVIRYEDLCRTPGDTLAQLQSHCDLSDDQAMTEFADSIHAPTYYRPTFTPAEMQIICEETSQTAARYGYEGEHVQHVKATVDDEQSRQGIGHEDRLLPS